MIGAVRFAARTHPGYVRELNEDSLISLTDHGLWVIADGMGGHAAGDVASAIVTENVAMIAPRLSAEDTLRALRRALEAAHGTIQAIAVDRGIDTMGATVVALAIKDQHFACLWAGDSRLYRLQDGKVELLTHDHSIVAALVEAGQISWDEAEHYPGSNQITNAVGVGDTLALDKVRGRVQAGDRFLLCSDGLSKYLTFEMIEQLLANRTVETVADHLLQLALEGGGADNISLIVIEIR